jgi:hypothetical protein
MIQLVALAAGLLLIAESEASDVAEQGFLSKYVPLGSDASKSSMNGYDKFITPNLNRVQYGQELRASPSTIVEDSDTPKIADREEAQAVQKLLARESYSPIALSAIGIGLLSLVTMLGLRLRRGLQPAGGVGPDIGMNMVSALGDNVMEMKSQDSDAKVDSGRVGWGQLPSNNAQPQTLCYADKEGAPIVKQQELAEQIQEALEKLFQKIQETLQDEDFQKQVKDIAGFVLEKAQDLGGKAMEYASDPEKQEQFQKATQNLIASTAELAQDVADASKDDKKREQLLQQFQESASNTVQSAVATAQDPEFQKKVKDTVDTASTKVQEFVNDPNVQAAAGKALDTAQGAVSSAVETAQDPEFQKKVKDTAGKASAAISKIGE